MADVNILIGTAGMLLLLVAFIRDEFIKDYENTIIQHAQLWRRRFAGVLCIYFKQHAISYS